MGHIKKMVLTGFKSFAKRTEIEFDRGINVIVGPNGSGKSNISDALCFVLGRLSTKSIRAAKARNLIFLGSKYAKPAREASVELIFDNTDRVFGVESDEVLIKRSVKLNGQSTYKINDAVKTRAEVIELLAQAGIDPYGFNLILQGEIQSIVKMHPEERRRIIEDVAGISIYETQKQKSLRELEKTAEKLKEISTILRDRTSYLNNLEKEKSQAQRYQDLKNLLRKLRASILKKRLDEKIKEINSIEKAITDNSLQRDKKREKADSIQIEINNLSDKLNQINQNIRKSSGLEQSKLREEITTVKAELEGLRVRKESYENRLQEVKKRIDEMNKSIPEIESEIKSLREKSPLTAQKAQELRRKKEELAQLQEERKKILTIKTELQTLRERVNDKQKHLSRIIAESESLLKQVDEIGSKLSFSTEKECLNALESFKKNLTSYKKDLNLQHLNELENEKIISRSETEINRAEEIKSKVEKMDVCPVCQSKITKFHIDRVFKEADEKIKNFKKELENSKVQLEIIRENKKSLIKKISETEEKIRILETELIFHKTIFEKTQHIKKSADYEQILRKELKELEDKCNSLENKSFNIDLIEEKYEAKLQEIEEISSRKEEDVNTTLLYKERELEKIKNIVERSNSDTKEIIRQIEEIKKIIEEKEEILRQKEDQEQKLNIRFQKMFNERDSIQKNIQEKSIVLNSLQTEIRQIEDQINYFRIGKAKLDSEKETIEIDLSDYSGVEFIQGSLIHLEERFQKTQIELESIGPINMRALEVYESVKKEYEIVKEKAQTLEKEKEEIMKIIEEIDKKKYKAFMKTFKSINDLFTRNFGRLSIKGTAYLELENEENIFEGGINIVVRLAKGKYFDVTSLSGGEQTLVALSLLFAIQEYKPYQFYVLDEIDAALDKRNSERLASLLEHYMQSGQYIVITHNDAIIINSNLLYGVSMHEGVSKILSIKLNEEKKKSAEDSISTNVQNEAEQQKENEIT